MPTVLSLDRIKTHSFLMQASKLYIHSLDWKHLSFNKYGLLNLFATNPNIQFYQMLILCNVWVFIHLPFESI